MSDYVSFSYYIQRDIAKALSLARDLATQFNSLGTPLL